MPQSYINSNFHIVFSTYQRLPRIQDPSRLWDYLGGIAKGLKSQSIVIGGTKDHVHLLLSLPADASLADVGNKLKSNSSKWMKVQEPRFQWQKGYSAFSVSCSKVESVAQYIRNQEQHHRRRDFRAELLALLKKHGVEFEERYLFD